MRPRTLQLTDGLAPLTQLGPARTSRSTQGNLELVTVVLPASCLTDPCVSRSGVARLALPPVHASAVERNGRAVEAAIAWPVLSVRGRVSAADLATRTPPFVADTTPPAPSYRIAPATLRALLYLLVAVSVAGAIAVGGWRPGYGSNVAAAGQASSSWRFA